MNTIFRLFLLFVQLYGISDPATGSSSYTTAGMGRAEVPEPEWSYSNLAAWPPLCHTGMHQSPISFKNLTPSELRCTKPPQPLEFSEGCTFKAESTSLKIDNGVNTIRVTFLPLGKTAGDRTNVCTLRDPSGATGAQKYQLTAMHFHAPPEHLFPHAAPDAELHIVFKAEDEHSVEPAVVVAVQLAASDAANTSATRALNHIMIDGPLPPRQASTTCTLERNLTVAEMLPQRQSYVTYSGSLTTPPCTEGVRFVIMTTPQLISKAAFNKLSQVLRQTWPENRLGNRRPTQPLNGREVCRYVDGRHPKTSNGQGVWGDYLDTIPATGDSVSEGGNPSGSEEGVKGNLSGADVGANQTEEEKDGKQLWPYVLKPHEAILFTAAAVILVVAALILYWWSNNANEKVDANEAEWLGTAAEVRAYHTNLGNAHLYHPLHQPKFHRKDTNLRVQRKQGHTAHMTSPHLLTFSQEAVCVAEEFGVAFYAPKNLKKFQVERFNGVRIAGIYATKASDGGSHLHVVDVEANWFLVSLSRVEVVSSSSIELSEENSVKQSESSRHSEECARRLPNTEGILEAHFHEAGGVLHCVVLTRWGAYETVLTNTSRIVARNIISFPFEMRNCFMSVGRTSGLVVVCQRSEKWLRYSLFEQRDNERIRMFDSPVNVQSFAVNPISNSVVLGGTRGEMVLYPSITEKNYFSDHWHHTPLTALSFSIDGKAFYSGAREGMILVWNTSSYTYKKVSCGLGCINSIAVPTGNGSRVLLSCAESTIAVLDLLQMQVEKFVEGVQWSTDESCSGLVVSQWMGQPAVILTGLPNVVRVCDPFTQQAIYSLHISSQMETIPSPPRHGIQYVGLLNNNRTIVTYEEFSGVSLPSLLRFWAYSSDSKRHEESMTICSPHRSQVLALTTDDTQQRVFTLSGEAMKCWVECKEDLNDAHAIGKKTWGNQSSCVTPSRLVQDLIISHDGSLCFISDDNVHVYNVKALHPGQPWQRVLTLTQHFSLSPLKNLTLLHECRALVATDAERVYFWSLAKPRRQATIWKDKGVGGKAAGITAMCGFSVNSVLVATESCNLWELSAADVNEMGKVVGQANSATEHRITFMKPLSLLKQPDRIAVVDSVSGFRVMHVSLEGKGGVNVQQFERTTARDESNETLSSLKQYFQEAPVRSNNFDGADENASTILDRASQVAEAQKWLVGVLADSAYTAPPMSALLSSYLQRRAGVATF